MSSAFLDTSALTRRYHRSETGANRVREICAPSRRHVLLVARLASIELAAALNRRVRDGTLPAQVRDRYWRMFQVDWAEQYQVVQPNEMVFVRAEALARRYPLRTLDALQLASALVAAAAAPGLKLQFWTADAQQARAAESEGLTTELVA